MFAYTYRFFATRPRLIIAILVGSIAYWGLPYLAHVWDFLPIAGAYSELKPISHFLLAWNIGVITYLKLRNPLKKRYHNKKSSQRE